MTTLEKSREFAERCGIPRFAPSDPVLVLREMMKREDWPVFIKRIGARIEDRYTGQPPVDFVRVYYMTDTTGLLAQEAVEFLRRGDE
jgi:hypothetical protein